jgi:AraC family transcriptional activator of pobA
MIATRAGQPMDKAVIGLDNRNIATNILCGTILALRTIPTYALYGEADNPGADWVHCETIQVRSRLHNYVIQPHRHERFFQILHLTAGEAQFTVDGRTSKLMPPCVVTLPPMVAHSYTFTPEVEGTVLTLFESRVAQVLPSPGSLADTFRAVQLVPLHEHEDVARALVPDIAALVAEWAGHAPGRREAIEARLMLILIALHRAQGRSRQAARGDIHRSRDHAMHFRQLVDRDFRSHRAIGFYAGALGLTPTHLNRVCRKHLGDTALGVIQQRIILEAKRYLTFTSLNAQEIAFALDFDDPAYFSRFFKKKTGFSPLDFRSRQQDPAA